MKANFKKLRKHRRYSDAFKKQIVSDFESGNYSVLQLKNLHGIGQQTVYSWIYKFSTFNEKGYRVIEMEDSTINKVKNLETKIKELEAALGRKQIMVEYLETMIDVAKEDLNIDIKKNYATPQSRNSNLKSKK